MLIFTGILALFNAILLVIILVGLMEEHTWIRGMLLDIKQEVKAVSWDVAETVRNTRKN